MTEWQDGDIDCRCLRDFNSAGHTLLAKTSDGSLQCSGPKENKHRGGEHRNEHTDKSSHHKTLLPGLPTTAGAKIGDTAPVPNTAASTVNSQVT
jgi:hypothetical protein